MMGVAGLHRLLEPLTRIIEAEADVLVVVAGMEGSPTSVVAGLVDIPVIGVPTSTGYGLGGDGTAALCSILQSCSPGTVREHRQRSGRRSRGRAWLPGATVARDQTEVLGSIGPQAEAMLQVVDDAHRAFPSP